jgi:hypothetical protein
VCKEDSRKYLCNFIDKASLDYILANRSKETKIQIKLMTDVSLNGQKASLIVNWVEIIEWDKKANKNTKITKLFLYFYKKEM